MKYVAIGKLNQNLLNPKNHVNISDYCIIGENQLKNMFTIRAETGTNLYLSPKDNFWYFADGSGGYNFDSKFITITKDFR